MNCCCLLILLMLFGGNNCGSSCGSRTDRNDRTDRNGNCCNNDHRPVPLPAPTPCGCDDDMMQPRGFSGFSSVGTCGCEEKDN